MEKVMHQARDRVFVKKAKGECFLIDKLITSLSKEGAKDNASLAAETLPCLKTKRPMVSN
jgi:hypothetical protein